MAMKLVRIMDRMASRKRKSVRDSIKVSVLPDCHVNMNIDAWSVENLAMGHTYAGTRLEVKNKKRLV